MYAPGGLLFKQGPTFRDWHQARSIVICPASWTSLNWVSIEEKRGPLEVVNSSTEVQLPVLQLLHRVSLCRCWSFVQGGFPFVPSISVLVQHDHCQMTSYEMCVTSQPKRKDWDVNWSEEETWMELTKWKCTRNGCIVTDIVSEVWWKSKIDEKEWW